MYVAVVALTLGQALVFASPALLAYAAILLAGFHLFVLLYEEPTLRQKFPADYPAFAASVPRWLPRLRPWRG
jgi:protein-S-isoprenylcysteine O-methyltransferase Ste14